MRGIHSCPRRCTADDQSQGQVRTLAPPYLQYNNIDQAGVVAVVVVGRLQHEGGVKFFFLVSFDLQLRQGSTTT